MTYKIYKLLHDAIAVINSSSNSDSTSYESEMLLDCNICLKGLPSVSFLWLYFGRIHKLIW